MNNGYAVNVATPTDVDVAPLTDNLPTEITISDKKPCRSTKRSKHVLLIGPTNAHARRRQASLQMGAHSGVRVTQCRHARLTTYKPMPVQVDGEPCRLVPSIIDIARRNQANMLQKPKLRGSALLLNLWVAGRCRSMDFSNLRFQRSLSSSYFYVIMFLFVIWCWFVLVFGGCSLISRILECWSYFGFNAENHWLYL